ncbi:MAG: hypothetical protein LBD73_09070 [Deferribacteraceae bacterium]|jgi:uncharacterized Zn finger protein|nr:hypothetical protein [Deferribacteraceae bacterium]
MNVAKLTEEQIKAAFRAEVLERAEGSIGQFQDCTVKGGDLFGKITGNHGSYSVSLYTSKTPLSFSCTCRSGSEGCKHAAALGLTFIYSPWLFTCAEKIDRAELTSVEDIHFYISVTPLKQIIDELRSAGIGLAKLSELTKLSSQQISAAVRSSEKGLAGSSGDLLKLASLYVLEHQARYRK